jgi:hypothetical protein
VIWQCPECQDATDGPTEPAENASCRLCASCTLTFGRLVHRKRRKRPSKRAKANPRLQHTWQGVDLAQELRRLVEFCPERVQARPPSLRVKRVPKVPRTFGWANYTYNLIDIRVWPEAHLGWVLGSIVHELAHFSAGHETKHSDDLFRMAMVELVRDGYGVEPAMPAGRRIAQLDHSIEDALVAWVESRKGA